MVYRRILYHVHATHHALSLYSVCTCAVMLFFHYCSASSSSVLGSVLLQDWLFNKANFLHDLYIELQNVVSPLFAQLGKVPLVRQSDLVLLQTRIVQLLDVSWQYLKPLIDPRAYQHTYQKIAVGLVSTWMAKGIV